MNRKESVYALTIEELQLPVITANRYVRMIHRDAKDRDIPRLRKEVTVREALSALPPYRWSGRRPKWHTTDHLLAKLVSLGFTRLDCLYLPQSTMTLKVMRSITKEEWLAKPAYLLGTLSSTALYHIGQGPAVDEFTVGDLMRLCDPDSNDYRYYRSRDLIEGCAKSFVATRALLAALGFRYEDGSFMQVHTRRKLAERLVEKCGLSKRSAVKTVAIAEAMGWVSFPD